MASNSIDGVVSFLKFLFVRAPIMGARKAFGDVPGFLAQIGRDLVTLPVFLFVALRAAFRKITGL